jgi:hypothetical protein
VVLGHRRHRGPAADQLDQEPGLPRAQRQPDHRAADRQRARHPARVGTDHHDRARHDVRHRDGGHRSLGRLDDGRRRCSGDGDALQRERPDIGRCHVRGDRAGACLGDRARCDQRPPRRRGRSAAVHQHAHHDAGRTRHRPRHYGRAEHQRDERAVPQAVERSDSGSSDQLRDRGRDRRHHRPFHAAHGARSDDRVDRHQPAREPARRHPSPSHPFRCVHPVRRPRGCGRSVQRLRGDDGECLRHWKPHGARRDPRGRHRRNVSRRWQVLDPGLDHRCSPHRDPEQDCAVPRHPRGGDARVQGARHHRPGAAPVRADPVVGLRTHEGQGNAPRCHAGGRLQGEGGRG